MTTSALVALCGDIQVGVAFNNVATDDASSFTWAAPGTVGALGEWTDVSALVLGYEINARGRQHDLDEAEAGEFEILFDNETGAFSEWNTTGPYYGLLLPKLWITVIVNASSTVYPRFTGHVSAWAPVWEDPMSVQCQVTAYDPVRLWNSALLASPGWSSLVLSLTPIGYWRVDEATGTIAADSSGNNHAATYTGTVVLDQPSLIATDADTAVNLDGTGAVSCPVGGFSAGGVNQGTVLLWFETSSTSGTQVLYDNRASSGAVGWAIAIESGQFLIADQTYPLASINYNIGASGQFCDGNPHMVLLNQFNRGWTCSVDVTNLTSQNWDQAFTAAGTCTFGGRNFALTGLLDGTVDELVVFDTNDIVLYTSELYAAATGGFEQQDTGARCTATATVINWPAAMCDFDTGIVECQTNTTNLTQTSALLMAQQAEETEGGRFFAQASGVMRFVNRRNQYTVSPFNTSQITFGDGPTEVHYLPGAEAPFDDIDIYNQAVLQPMGGNVYTVNNLPSQAVFGSSTWTPNATPLNLTSDTRNPLYRAEWVANVHGRPVTRFDELVVDMLDVLALDGAEGSDYDDGDDFDDDLTYDAGLNVVAILALDVGSRVTVNRHTFPGGSAFSQIAIVEQISEQVTLGGDGNTAGWQITFALSGVGAIMPWIAADTTYGVAGTAIAGY